MRWRAPYGCPQDRHGVAGHVRHVGGNQSFRSLGKGSKLHCLATPLSLLTNNKNKQVHDYDAILTLSLRSQNGCLMNYILSILEIFKPTSLKLTNYLFRMLFCSRVCMLCAYVCGCAGWILYLVLIPHFRPSRSFSAVCIYIYLGPTN